LRSRGEAGQLTVFVVVLTLPLLLLAGLVVDGGGVLAAHQRAIAAAFEAARAGAQAVDLNRLRSSGAVVLDPDEARAEALGYLAAVGQTGDVSVIGDAVTVTVSLRHPLAVLSVVGIGPVTVSGTATATATQGINGGGQ
jgi:Flp pilus assembly protein TadG